MYLMKQRSKQAKRMAQTNPVMTPNRMLRIILWRLSMEAVDDDDDDDDDDREAADNIAPPPAGRLANRSQVVMKQLGSIT